MLLTTLLVLMMGLGGTLHASTNDCAHAHCDNHVTATEHHDEKASVETIDGAKSGSHDLANDDCSPFMCNFLALGLVSSEPLFDQFEAALTWQVLSLVALNETDNPDRPPNI